MNIEFKRDNVFVKAEYNFTEENKIRVAKCDCGYYIRNIKKDEFISISKCPNCGAKLKPQRIINSKTDYIAFNRVEEYKFTEEKGYLKVRKLRVEIEKTTQHPEELDLVFKDKIHEFIFEYETNKRGKRVYKPKVIENKEPATTLLKGSLRYYDLPSIYYDENVSKDLKSLNASGGSSGLEDIIWGINNRYKYLEDALKMGVYYGYATQINELKRFNQRVVEHFNKNNIEYLHKRYKYLVASYRHRTPGVYDLLEKFGIYYESSSTEETRERIELEGKKLAVIDTIIARTDDIDAVSNYNTMQYLDDYALLISEVGFTIDEIIELYQHFDRQAYRLYSITTFSNAYYNYKKLGIPIDKKPKECAIYYKKMQSLYNVCNSSDFTNNVVDLDKGDKDIKLRFSDVEEAIRKLYESNSYKVLDDILVKAFMNERCIPYKLAYVIEEERTNKIYDLKAIGYSNSRCYELPSEKRSSYPLTIVTEDNEIIDNQNDIKKFLRDKKREIIGKGVSSC